MLEIRLLCLLVGSLGLQSLTVSGWLWWQQTSAERRCEQEEEQLTPYDSEEDTTSKKTPDGYALASKDTGITDWEFKIVRASRDLFREPQVLKQLCDEEAQAGWMLLEKLDDRRIRFKRPTALRHIIKPEHLPYDPYRTHYGPSSPDWVTALGAIAFLAALLLPVYLGYALVSVTLSHDRAQTSTSPEPVPTAPQKQPTPNAPSPRP
jgi:hypothetical protein